MTMYVRKEHNEQAKCNRGDDQPYPGVSYPGVTYTGSLYIRRGEEPGKGSCGTLPQGSFCVPPCLPYCMPK